MMWVVKSAVLGWNRLLLPTWFDKLTTSVRDRRPMLRRGFIDGGVERAVMRDEWCERGLKRSMYIEVFSEPGFARHEAPKVCSRSAKWLTGAERRSLPRRRRANCCTANVVSPED